METFREILDPGFLLRNSVYVGLLVGLACPLVGTYVIMRRWIFTGVALPQVSSLGIAFAFALHTWLGISHFEGSEQGLALAGSVTATIIAILLLAFMERRGKGIVEGRIGTLYALGGAWSVLLLLKNPYGEHGLLDRLKGEIIAVSDSDLIISGSAFAVVLLLLFFFHKELLLVSFDREMAITLKKNVLLWDIILYLIVGITISVAVLSVGPLVTFGFLIIPALAAHSISRSMRQFAIISATIGLLTAFFGFALAYKYDLPVGPTDVALLGVILALVFLGNQLKGLLSPNRNA
jgi:ABC-type Mn2+/Zn2+ transport system permease subunit